MTTLTPEEISAAMLPKGSGPFLVLGWPFGKLFNGRVSKGSRYYGICPTGDVGGEIRYWLTLA